MMIYSYELGHKGRLVFPLLLLVLPSFFFLCMSAMSHSQLVSLPSLCRFPSSSCLEGIQPSPPSVPSLLPFSFSPRKTGTTGATLTFLEGRRGRTRKEKRAKTTSKNGPKRQQRRQPHLLEFFGRECPHCQSMSGLVSRLSVPVCRLEVWHNSENMKVLQTIDKHIKCGGLPFYYNLKTGQYVCGATTFYNLSLWADDRPCRSHFPPPLKPEELDALGRNTGFFARVLRSLDEVRAKGQQIMQQRLEDEIRKSHRGQPPVV